MGGATSTEGHVANEEREVEALAASTGALPMLEKSFSVLADPCTNLVPSFALERALALNIGNLFDEEGKPVTGRLPLLMVSLGASIVDLFFLHEKDGMGWVNVMKGYIKCCGRMAVSSSFNNLLRVFVLAAKKVGIEIGLEFESSDYYDDSKMSDSIMVEDVVMLLRLCWLLSLYSKISEVPEVKEKHSLPDISHLALSAIVSCAEGGHGMDVWDTEILNGQVQLPAQKFEMWLLTTVPNLAASLSKFVHAALQRLSTSEVGREPSFSLVSGNSSTESSSTLLTCGRAWAISLNTRGTINDEILRACFPRTDKDIDEMLLYRSCVHGKGLNRLWSNIEGYHGPVLLLISASSGGVDESNASAKKWVVGALAAEGFENRDVFYGTSGSLFSMSPLFQTFAPSGKEKNFIYSHLQPARRVYDPHPKPVGIAFGGAVGSERLHIDEDFATVTVRHHAFDKTYQPGPLIPNQGFAQVEASISEVEAWGLGGTSVKEKQNAYKTREDLFTEQRRKVDMKTFASWEDSPEKMMMDMISDPNAVRREER